MLLILYCRARTFFFLNGIIWLQESNQLNIVPSTITILLVFQNCASRRAGLQHLSDESQWPQPVWRSPQPPAECRSTAKHHSARGRGCSLRQPGADAHREYVSLTVVLLNSHCLFGIWYKYNHMWLIVIIDWSLAMALTAICSHRSTSLSGHGKAHFQWTSECSGWSGIFRGPNCVHDN